jgi:hypothetical protein
VAAAATLSGCASAPPTPSGAILPMEGGRYQSTVRSSEEADAQRIAMRDAEITCNKTPPKAYMPWEAKPAPAKFMVVSQTTKNKEGKEIKSSDNKMMDAGIAVGLRKLGLEAKDSITVTTIFKCE